MTAASGRWAWAEVDLGAVRDNVAHLIGLASPAALWAVVKADGYGHGSVAVARAAISGGASGLCVALVTEGEELRAAGIDVPILVLSHQPFAQFERMVAASLTPTLYTADAIDAFAAAVSSTASRTAAFAVHLMVDTGMQRIGAAPSDAVALATRIEHCDRLRLDGVCTHLACADEPTSGATGEQLARFDAVLAALADAGIEPPSVHVANSAAALSSPASRRSLVRAGIAIYGISPGPAVDDLAAGLRPAMRLVARVSHLKRVAAGTHVSYGWRHRFEHDTHVATVPIGYADGVPRRLGTLPDRPGADVLIGGRRCPIVGVVTMDQLVVDVGGAGRGFDVAVGDAVVLIGRQGSEAIRAEEWAALLDTIGYEIVCGIGRRIERVVADDANLSRPARTS